MCNEESGFVLRTLNLKIKRKKVIYICGAIILKTKTNLKLHTGVIDFRN